MNIPKNNKTKTINQLALGDKESVSYLFLLKYWLFGSKNLNNYLVIEDSLGEMPPQMYETK